MAKQRTRLYFATDLHGSGKCFRKFLNGGPIYGADVLVLGGDLAGKAIQTIDPRRQAAASSSASAAPTTTSRTATSCEASSS